MWVELEPLSLGINMCCTGQRKLMKKGLRSGHWDHRAFSFVRVFGRQHCNWGGGRDGGGGCVGMLVVSLERGWVGAAQAKA